jgi:Rrf2 family protein
MKLSTKGRYGTRALIDIALHHDEEPIPLKDIARRQQISLPYLEHLIGHLIEGGIVRSTRGAGGGVSLAKPPREIRLSEVIGLLEGSMALVSCVNDPAVCNRSQSCATHDIWGRLKKAMDDVLESTTLEELVEGQKGKQAAMYYI